MNSYTATNGKVWQRISDGFMHNETIYLGVNDRITNYQEVDKPVVVVENDEEEITTLRRQGWNKE